MASGQETGESEIEIAIAVSDAETGMRLDRLLTQRLEGLSRMRVQALIRSGAVKCARQTIGDPGHRVKPGQSYEVLVPPPEPASPAAEAIALNVVYEDGDLIVIDKPAGLVVHPAPGHAEGTLVNALLAHCKESLSGIGGVRRPGIVHRLDKDTSGLLVVAKTDAAHQGLTSQFSAHGADGRLVRAYLALCWGVPPRGRGVIDAPLARSTANRTKIAVVHGASGRRAVTHYEVIRSFSGVEGAPVASLLRLELETGRTHQIRVHLAHIGRPVLGDPVYGTGFKASASRLNANAAEALKSLGRQALHAAELGFEHPVTGDILLFKSEPPADFRALLEGLAKQSRPAIPKSRR